MHTPVPKVMEDLYSYFCLKIFFFLSFSCEFGLDLMCELKSIIPIIVFTTNARIT